jgi:hypothetical protein
MMEDKREGHGLEYGSITGSKFEGKEQYASDAKMEADGS